MASIRRQCFDNSEQRERITDTAECFPSWCQWASMDLRLDKCCVFGMAKKQNKFTELHSDNTRDMGGQQTGSSGRSLNGKFEYLGKLFILKMDNETAKDLIVNKLKTSLIITSHLTIRPQNKH